MDRSNVILQGIVGSTAYGLAGPNSDIDQLGIYAAPMSVVLGLNGSGDLENGPQSVADSLVQHEPDLTLHEVGKYVRLALSANPTILELLWLKDYSVVAGSGAELVLNRELFLSNRVKARYGGYAKAQAERLLRNHLDTGVATFQSDVRNRTVKHGRHCMRLLLQGAQLLREGTMVVNVSEYRDQIFEAGERAAHDPEAFHVEAMGLLEGFYEIESVLPERPDIERANKMLQQIRWEAWEKTEK